MSNNTNGRSFFALPPEIRQQILLALHPPPQLTLQSIPAFQDERFHTTFPIPPSPSQFHGLLMDIQDVFKDEKQKILRSRIILHQIHPLLDNDAEYVHSVWKKNHIAWKEGIEDQVRVLAAQWGRELSFRPERTFSRQQLLGLVMLLLFFIVVFVTAFSSTIAALWVLWNEKLEARLFWDELTCRPILVGEGVYFHPCFVNNN